MQVADNLFDGIPNDLAEEYFTQLHLGQGVRIERIVSQGHCSPEGFWYDQDEDEWVLVLQGSATLQFKNPPCEVELRRGSYLHIPAHTLHRVDRTEPDQKTIWLAVHSQPSPALGGRGDRLVE